MMPELLHTKFNEIVGINDRDFERARNFFSRKRLQKKRLILEPGAVCKYTIFVERGLLRSYTVDEKGAEHILQFAMEGWWAADLYSFLTGEASAYHIEALEDSELLVIDKESWEALLEEVPALERFFRILVQNNLIATQRRLMCTFSKPAEERYLDLVEAVPSVARRVPQHMIASYIGITRESLSRIRKKLVSGQ